MGQKRIRHSADFKAKVALEALKGLKTINELATQYQVHPTQISQWKRQVTVKAKELFGSATRSGQDAEAREAKLYEEVGRLKMELDWVKKLPGSVETKRQWIQPGHAHLSVRRQCVLLGLGRGSWYYQPTSVSAETLEVMQAIDRQYTRTPFYGSRRMTVYLNHLGYPVNRKRIQRLMAQMGLAGVAPGPQTSRPHPEHTVYPYLLRDLVIHRPNQVWCTDVTYVPMARGFMFLVAILDWYSRYVVAWMVSNTQDTTFCLEALEQAFTQGCPEIFNPDSAVENYYGGGCAIDGTRLPGELAPACGG